jgi:hypothetical protein
MRWRQRLNHEAASVLIALFVTLAIVTAVYRWPTNLLVDLAVPPAVVGLLILMRTRR